MKPKVKKKTTDTSGIIVGLGSKLDAVEAVCDVIGMTDIPVVSQGTELISAGICVARGDYIGAGLSIGSMVPGVGKAAETAKIAYKSKKAVDTAATIGKETKQVAKKIKDAGNRSSSKKMNDTSGKRPKNQQKEPSKTAAKDTEIEPIKEKQDGHFDSYEWWGIPERKPAGDSIFAHGQPSVRGQKSNFEKFNYRTNSNPSLNQQVRGINKPNFGI
jgi:hypothetical protein